MNLRNSHSTTSRSTTRHCRRPSRINQRPPLAAAFKIEPVWLDLHRSYPDSVDRSSNLLYKRAGCQRTLLYYLYLVTIMTTFLDLPPKVRLEVYRYLLLTRSTKFVAPLDNLAYHDLQPAILRTCGLINREARTVLSRENISYKSSTIPHFLRKK